MGSNSNKSNGGSTDFFSLHDDASNNASYLTQYAQYRQSGDLCAYLNITKHSKQDDNHLDEKLDLLEAMNTSLTSFDTAGLWGLLFPSIVRQQRVAECAYTHYMATIQSASYYESTIVYYTKYGYMSTIWPWIVLPSSLSVVAILLNLSLIIVTAKKISLSKLCNWLLAFDSFCQIPAVLPFLVNLVGLIANVDGIDHRVCLATFMLSTGSSFASFLAVFLMSLERLLIVLFPLRMNRVSASIVKLCSILAFIICSLFGFWMTLSMYNVWTIINLPFIRWLYCNTGLYSDVLNTPISYILLSLSICNYAMIGICIVWRRHHNLTATTVLQKQQQQPAKMAVKIEESISLLMMRRMLRSVLIISMVLLIGWVIGSAARNQVTTFTRYALNATVSAIFTNERAAQRTYSDVDSWLIGLVTCLFVIAAGINAPVLVISNLEYRKAYRRTFVYIFTGVKTSVGPLFITNKPPAAAAAAGQQPTIIVASAAVNY